MRINLVLLMALTISISAQAQIRTDFKDVSKGKQMDLLQEGNTLTLNQEGTVQEFNPPSKMFATFMGGVFQPTSLTVNSSGHTMNYNFDNQLPVMTAQVNHYIFDKYGKWGWAASIGYSYSQYQDTVTTALHIVPITANIAYRMELKDTQKIIPYFMAGPSLWTFFQRGPDAYNTSESSLFGAGTAGLSFNLNRLHILKSRNDTEIVLQYQRTIGPSVAGMDFNGNSFQIGGTIAL